MGHDQSPRWRPLDLRRTMTDARRWLVEAEDNPLVTDAERVAELDARTARKTVADRCWWQFLDGSIVERFDADTWRTVAIMDADRFSDRHGYKEADAKITVREDAPTELRDAILAIADRVGMKMSKMRDIICRVLLSRPDIDNWSDLNISNEVDILIHGCHWYKVYDIAEALYESIDKSDLADQFEAWLNQYFREYGIGWEMRDGQVIIRGSADFSDATKRAVDSLTLTGRDGSANEMREALRDISRRPEPDVTGAIQHAIAALESTARDVTKRPNHTLGKIVRDLGLPAPLDTAIDKMWGYASERARHVREGQTVHTSEAELIVSVACAACTFLSNRDT